MIAVDTNILVFAHREDSEWHAPAFAALAKLAQQPAPWAIAWPCIHEFLAIVTHPRVYRPPTPLAVACDQVDAWLEAPGLVLLGESDGYWPALRQRLLEAKVTGPLVHDARVAALCAVHGIDALWTHDRDFGRFSDLTIRNPLV